MATVIETLRFEFKTPDGDFIPPWSTIDIEGSLKLEMMDNKKPIRLGEPVLIVHPTYSANIQIWWGGQIHDWSNKGEASALIVRHWEMDQGDNKVEVLYAEKPFLPPKGTNKI